MHKEHRLAKLSDSQRAAVKDLLANTEPIMVPSPVTATKPPLPTRILNRFIDWYSDKI